MPKRGERMQKLLTLLITWAVLLAFFFVYEAYFVRSQREFVQERGFRVLAALSKELTAKYDQAGLSIVSFAKLADQDPPPSQESLRQYLEIYLNDALADDPRLDVTECWKSHEGKLPIESIADDRSGLILSINCVAKTAQSNPDHPGLNRKVPLYVDLQPWLRDAFQKLGDYFDEVLVADSTGHILFQQTITGPRITDLKDLVPNPDSAQQKNGLIPTESGAAQKKPPTNNNKPKKDQEVNVQEVSGFQKLKEASALTAIKFVGEDYQLFSQPASIPLVNYPSGGSTMNLLVCGLRRKESLESESHAVPYSTLIWLALIGVALFSLSWPLFKLRLMSNTERFTPRDGWYLILAIFLASISAMLMLLNASYTAQAQSATDSRMQWLAAEIKAHVKSEFGLAYRQLNQFSQDPLFAEKVKDLKLKPKVTDKVADYFTNSKTEPCYPYFEIAFWASKDGQQRLKFDVRPIATPPVDVSRRSFFRDAISDTKSPSQLDAATVPQPPVCKPILEDVSLLPLHVQAIESPNTGEFFATLSAAFVAKPGEEAEKEIAVAALTSPLLSLVDPVLPPGYSFAVVDANCNVLFHSDKIRNLRENFCQESKNKNELEPVFFSGADTSLNISYRGHPERAFVTALPLPNLSSGQSFLIVFGEADQQVTLNLAIILVCSILMGTYFLIPLLAAGLHLSLRGPLQLIYAPRLIWPCKEKAVCYVHCFIANAFTLLLFWWFYQGLYEAPLLALTLAVAILSVAFVILRLRFPPQRLFWLGASLTCAALILLGLLVLPGLPGSFGETRAEWGIVLGLLAVFGLIAVFLSGESSRLMPPMLLRLGTPDRLKRFAERHFALAYALAAVSVITAAGLVPCVGCFKYAYDAVSELSLKRDQLILSDRLLARTSRIHKYYEIVRAPKVANTRFGEKLDRYDCGFFIVNCEVTLASDAVAPIVPVVPTVPSPISLDPCKKIDPKKVPSDWISGMNNWIEKHLARATLTFPSNPIGRQMSRLGVASTDDPNTSWEHPSKELAPACFQLEWRTNSRLSDTVVRSVYPGWEGLPWWVYFFLVIFWVVMILWLISLVKKIFFTEIETTPALNTVDWKSVTEIQNNYLVIGPAKSGKTEMLARVPGLPDHDWRDLRVGLNRIIADPNYRQPTCQGRVLVLDHFEFNMWDPEYNLARLKLLEGLLYESSCKLVVISTVDPLYFLTEGAPEILTNSKDPEVAPRLLDRWTRALSKLTPVHLKDIDKEAFEKKVSEFGTNDSKCLALATWIKDECGCTSFLRTIGLDILKQFRGKDDADRKSLVATVLDRANQYYHVLWSSLTASERLVLYQLALDGWANPKNTGAIQQLERKLLIHRAPMFRIMNESFRKFVESTEHAEEIEQWEKQEQQSTWRALRFILVAGAIGVGVWLLYAQASLFQVGVGYVAAIGTLLTAIAGLFSRSRRSMPADSGATPSSS